MYLNKVVLVVFLTGGALIGLTTAKPAPAPTFGVIGEILFGPAPAPAPAHPINVNVAPQNNARYYQYQPQPTQYQAMPQPPTPPPPPTANQQYGIPSQGQQSGQSEQIPNA